MEIIQDPPSGQEHYVQELMSRVSSLEALVRRLEATIAKLVPSSGSAPSTDTTPPATSTSAKVATTKAKDTSPVKPPSPAASKKKRVAALRPFQRPSPDAVSKDFQYVYIGRSRKIARTEVRTRFRRAGVDTGRVLDINFPASGVIGVLIHQDYIPKFTELMNEAECEFITDFDPCDPVNLADPKFASLSDSAREQSMFDIVHNRAIDTLLFLRPHLVEPVARSFLKMGWIADCDLEDIIRAADTRLRRTDPKKADFIFARKFKDTEHDLDGDSDLSL